MGIFIHKVAILAKNDQSGVQRPLYISRTVNATENLVRYSESAENFLSRMSHQIFAYFVFWPKDRQFSKIFQNFPKFCIFRKHFFLKKFLNGFLSDKKYQT